MLAPPRGPIRDIAVTDLFSMPLGEWFVLFASDILSPRHDQVNDLHQYGLIVLIQGGDSQFE
jgi:hypothetical protein